MSQRNARVEKMTRDKTNDTEVDFGPIDKILEADLATLEEILGTRMAKVVRRFMYREAKKLEREILYGDPRGVVPTGLLHLGEDDDQ